MTREIVGRRDGSKSGTETQIGVTEERLSSIDLNGLDLTVSGESDFGRHGSTRKSGWSEGLEKQALVGRLRAPLRRLFGGDYRFTVEQGLGALGIGIAIASSAFASYMISQNREGQAVGGGLGQQASAVWSSHFANADIDPITTGSTVPAAGLDASAPKLPGYVLRDVFEGVALVEGKDGVRAVQPGFTLPEGSKVTAIERRGGKWVVVTTGGVIPEEP